MIVSVLRKMTNRWLVPGIVLAAACFPAAAAYPSPQNKKWSYDFSENVKYFDTPLEACKSYVKEKYPNDNYKAAIEATKDPETYRCSADETYIGLVYKRSVN